MTAAETFDRQRCGLKTQCAHNETVIAGLIAALHGISLGAQNSATSKEALGKEARAAIAKATGAA